MENLLPQITQLTGLYVPRILGTLAILVIGWLLALIVSGAIRKVMRRLTLDDRLSRWISADKQQEQLAVEELVAKGCFYLIMLFVLVGAFQALGITLITEPINNLLNELFRFAPKLLGALLLTVIAWVVAKVLKLIVGKGLSAARMDERIGSRVGMDDGKLPLSETIADVVFWLALLLFLPAILSTLGLAGPLGPVQGMMGKILDYIPSIFSAAVIALVGWLVARIIQRIVTSFLGAIGTDSLSERIGLAQALGKQKLSEVLGVVVYILILLPILVAALNALQLDAVTRPASMMLEMILTSLPKIFAAIVILAISFVIGKMVSELAARLLEGAGFNGILSKLGIGTAVNEGKWTPSSTVGYLVLAGIMIFATIEAAGQLGFETLGGLFSDFLVLAGHVLLGTVIFGLGLMIANAVANTIRSTNSPNAGFLALSARIAILVFVGAMALRQMGLANEIIDLAFGLMLGAVAVAAAIAFGFGGREVAGRELDSWVKSLKANKEGQ